MGVRVGHGGGQESVSDSGGGEDVGEWFELGTIPYVDEKMRELTTSREADPLAVELANGPDFAEWWSGASVEDKRRLTRLLMEIRILPGKAGAKKFDPHRVQIAWRQ